MRVHVRDTQMTRALSELQPGSAALLLDSSFYALIKKSIAAPSQVVIKQPVASLFHDIKLKQIPPSYDPGITLISTK